MMLEIWFAAAATTIFILRDYKKTRRDDKIC